MESKEVNDKKIHKKDKKARKILEKLAKKSKSELDTSEVGSSTQARPASKTYFKYDPLATVGLLALIFLSSQLVVAFVVVTVFKNFDFTQIAWLGQIDPTVLLQFLAILGAEAMAIFLIVKVLSFAGKKLKDIGFRFPSLWDATVAVIGWIVYFMIFLIVASFISALVTIPEQSQDIGFDQAGTGLELLLAFLSLVVIVPIAEEFMFRGFLFHSLRQKYKFLPAALVTSLIFGAGHLYSSLQSDLLWLVALDTLILSMVMCFLIERGNSLWSTIFMHMTKNFLAFVMLFGPGLWLLF